MARSVLDVTFPTSVLQWTDASQAQMRLSGRASNVGAEYECKALSCVQRSYVGRW